MPPPIEPSTEPSPGPVAAARSKHAKTSPFAAICLYLLIVFVGTAIVAPRFHATAQFLFQEVNWRFGRLAGQPFYRFVYGTLVLLAIIALPWLLKSLAIRSLSEVGLRRGFRHVAEGIQGAAWGVISFLVLTALLVASGIRVLDLENGPALWRNQLKDILFTSVCLAFVLELVFRGAFFSAVRREQPFWSAAILSAVLYASVLFLERPQNLQRIEWTSGFAVLSQMLSAFTSSEKLIPALPNLILVGVLLALAFERTGALHFSVGLHASLLLGLRSFGALTNASAKDSSAFWGSDKLIDGWIITIVLLLLVLFIERTLPPRKQVET